MYALIQTVVGNLLGEDMKENQDSIEISKPIMIMLGSNIPNVPNDRILSNLIPYSFCQSVKINKKHIIKITELAENDELVSTYKMTWQKFYNQQVNIRK